MSGNGSVLNLLYKFTT